MAGGSMGLLAIFSFSSSASWRRLALALLFWNQILTWVSVRLSEAENSALSAMDRYCFWRNFRSRARSWDVVKGVRGFRLVLCFRNVHFWGLILGGLGGTENKYQHLVNMSILPLFIWLIQGGMSFHTLVSFF